MKLICLANLRFPTEKGQGWQIAKMCEAFVLNGAEVELWHPNRKQPPSLINQDPFSFYNLKPILKIRAIFNWDVMPLEKYLPPSIFRLLFIVYSFSWGLLVVLKTKKMLADIYYTREFPIIFWLTLFKLPVIYEVHYISGILNKLIMGFVAKSRHIKLVVTMTNFLKQRCLKMGFAEDKVLVLADAVELKMFANLPSKDECRLKINLPKNKKIIGYIGRFENMGKGKGITELIKAVAEIVKSNLARKPYFSSFFLVGG